MKQYPGGEKKPQGGSGSKKTTNPDLINTLQPTIHERTIKSDYLDYIRLGYQSKYFKTIELRPDTTTYNTVKEGDIIKFSSGSRATCRVRVTRVVKTEKSIEQTISELSYDDIIGIMPDLQEQFKPKKINDLRNRIQQLAQGVLSHTYQKNALLIHFELDNLP